MAASSKIVAVGDIHGKYDKLTELMNKLNEKVDFNESTLVFLGDYIDGGRESRQVVEALIQFQRLYPHWKFLYGNHEWLFEEAITFKKNHQKFYLWWNQGGKRTAESYFPPSMSDYEKATANIEDFIPAEHFEWIHDLDMFYESDSFIFVHAGLVPGFDISDQNWFEMIWIREQFINSDYDWGKRVVFGHTVQNNLEPWVMPNKIGIDTMHHGKGAITAVILDDNNPDDFEFVTSGVS